MRCATQIAERLAPLRLATDEPQGDVQVGTENTSSTADIACHQVPSRRVHRKKDRGLNANEKQWLLTRERAERIAAEIREHWRRREVDADVWIEQLNDIGGGEHVVRSSLAFTASPRGNR
jgi:hypothetical protein